MRSAFRDAKSHVYSRPHERPLKPREVGQVHVTVSIIVRAGAARIGNSLRPGGIYRKCRLRPSWTTLCVDEGPGGERQ